MLEYVGYRDCERFERWSSGISIYVMTSRSGIFGRRYFLPLANLTTKFHPSADHRSKDRALAVCIALRLWYAISITLWTLITQPEMCKRGR